MILGKACRICGCKTFRESVEPYISCTSCGHEYHKSKPSTKYIINDDLSSENPDTTNSLDLFKSRVLKSSMASHDVLVDIGSASGKFLYQNKKFFRKHLGIEITKESIDFSRKKLRLNISTTLNLKEKISVVTFWHSIEHIPIDKAEKLLRNIEKHSQKDTRLIISVPNSGSLMYNLFGKDWAYFDKSSHYNQFSRKSMDLLLKKYNFFPKRDFYSFSYTMFGYLQGFLNVFNGIHNFLYYYQKRGNDFSLGKFPILMLLIYNGLLSIIFFIPSLILSLFDLVFIRKAGVMTVCYSFNKL